MRTDNVWHQCGLKSLVQSTWKTFFGILFTLSNALCAIEKRKNRFTNPICNRRGVCNQGGKILLNTRLLCYMKMFNNIPSGIVSFTDPRRDHINCLVNRRSCKHLCSFSCALFCTKCLSVHLSENAADPQMHVRFFIWAWVFGMVVNL